MQQPETLLHIDSQVIYNPKPIQQTISMKRIYFLFLVVLTGCSTLTPLQKSRFISVNHLIETGNYIEARDVIEDMVNDEESQQWPRTWYTRGVLAQTAPAKQKLYPDRYFVAFESYEKARSLDQNGRLDRQLAPRYILLANEFKKMGEKSYKDQKYKDALQAFELAIEINQNEILSMPVDTHLVYNAALAAYEADNHKKAIRYLSQVEDYNYSTNATHLLFSTYLESGDTLSAEKLMAAGIKKYEDNENLVLLLADLHFQTKNIQAALNVLDTAALSDSSNHIFPFTKGLIYQKTDQFPEAIEAYQQALALAPEELMIHTNIATCYFNIGVEIEEHARQITSNSKVLEQKKQSAEAFRSSLTWLDKVWEQEPDDQMVLRRLYELYKVLDVGDKVKSMEQMIH